MGIRLIGHRSALNDTLPADIDRLLDALHAPNASEWLSADAAAEALGITRRTFNKLCATGRLR